MKVEMANSPSPYEIIVKGDVAYINLFENAQEIPTEEQPKWTCDTYQIVVMNRPNLEESIQTNYDKWMKKAKESEVGSHTPTVEERTSALESAMLDIILGGLYG